MAYTTINKSTEHFDTKVYTGNGTSQTLDMDNLGMLWMKNRTETSNHNLFDSVRGGYYVSDPGPNLRPNGTTAGHGSDITSAYGITFGSSSSTIGSDGGGYNYNQNGKSYVGWQWRANGTGSANTDGNVASTVSANTTAGFSIVKWSGTTNNKTIGHGLGAVPAMVIAKNTGGSGTNWIVWHKSLTSGYYLKLNLTNAEDNANSYFTADPTNSILSLTGNTAMNSSGNDMIAYCFAEKTGYSKFGSYIGNGNADGSFIYTGFSPAWVMIKKTNDTHAWRIYDGVRDTHNLTEKILEPNTSNAEATSGTYVLDLVSNGFKFRGNGDGVNGSGQSFIYMAFAEAPLVGTNNVPATAR